MKLALALIALTLTACTSVKREHALPPQGLDAPRANGTSRVVFYNDTSVWGFPTSNRIGIRIDGKGVAAPYSGEYVQIDIPSGEHMLELSHYDMAYFSDVYTLTVGNDPLYIRVYCTPVHTEFEASRDLPTELKDNFRPIDE